jgi:hypothetical protein
LMDILSRFPFLVENIELSFPADSPAGQVKNAE